MRFARPLLGLFLETGEKLPGRFRENRKIPHVPPNWGTHLGLTHFRSSGGAHIWHLDSARQSESSAPNRMSLPLTFGEI
jgi:hypothetical protein